MSVSIDVGHWLQSVPVAWISWPVTVISAVVILFVALPAIIPGVRTRYLGRLLILCFVVLVPMLPLAALDWGYRTHIGTTYAERSASEYADSIQAKRPFHIDAYYALHARLMQNKSVVGTIPEISRSLTWTSIRTQASFTAAVVGLAPDLRDAILAPRASSAEVERVLMRWQKYLSRVPSAHGYVDKKLARSQGIQPGDILATEFDGRSASMTVSGIVPDNELAGSGPAVVFPLATAQQLFHYGDRITHVQVVVVPVGNRNRTETAALLRRVKGIPVQSVKPGVWSISATIRTQQAGNFDSWMALVCLLLVLLGTGIARILYGGRGRTRRAETRR